MMKKYLTTALLICALAAPAWSHNVCMTASFDGDGVTGEAYFSTGEPVENSSVTVESEGKTVGQGQTDTQGTFNLTLPPGIKTARVTINAGMGHVAHEDLIREEIPLTTQTPSPAGASMEDIRKAVSAEIAPIKQMVMELHKAHSKPDLPRILGGIGYIVGMVGAFMWGRSRRD